MATIGTAATTNIVNGEENTVAGANFLVLPYNIPDGVKLSYKATNEQGYVEFPEIIAPTNIFLASGITFKFSWNGSGRVTLIRQA